MNNNLSNVEKNLKTIAKKYENIKYSLSLAVLFLMKGASTFSDDNVIQETEKKDILTENKNEKSESKEIKIEKQKKQKLKASWVNMQFAPNDIYSNYFSKAEAEKTPIPTISKI